MLTVVSYSIDVSTVLNERKPLLNYFQDFLNYSKVFTQNILSSIVKSFELDFRSLNYHIEELFFT